MPQLKKPNEILDLDEIKGTEAHVVFDIDQIKNAQLSIGKLVQSMTIPIGEIQALRALVVPSASVIDGIKQMKALMVSVEDTHKAFVDAFAPTQEISKIVGKMFKQHAEEFQRVADIGNIIREQWVKTIEETSTQTNWLQTSEQLRLEAATHVPALRQEYESIVDDLPLSLTFTIPKVTPTYKTKPVSTHLSEEDKEDIVARLANKVVEVMIEKYDAIQLTRNEFTSGVIVETHDIHSGQLQWDGLTLNLNEATIRYKDFLPITISLETQPMKWFVCLIKKAGKVAEYTELSIATGHTSENQGRQNSEVARYVQQVKQKLIPKLEKAGMTRKEINQMIQPIDKIGFVLRKISVTEK